MQSPIARDTAGDREAERADEQFDEAKQDERAAQDRGGGAMQHMRAEPFAELGQQSPGAEQQQQIEEEGNEQQRRRFMPSEMAVLAHRHDEGADDIDRCGYGGARRRERQHIAPMGRDLPNRQGRIARRRDRRDGCRVDEKFGERRNPSDEARLREGERCRGERARNEGGSRMERAEADVQTGGEEQESTEPGQGAQGWYGDFCCGHAWPWRALGTRQSLLSPGSGHHASAVCGLCVMGVSARKVTLMRGRASRYSDRPARPFSGKSAAPHERFPIEWTHPIERKTLFGKATLGRLVSAVNDHISRLWRWPVGCLACGGSGPPTVTRGHGREAALGQMALVRAGGQDAELGCEARLGRACTRQYAADRDAGQSSRAGRCFDDRAREPDCSAADRRNWRAARPVQRGASAFRRFEFASRSEKLSFCSARECDRLA